MDKKTDKKLIFFGAGEVCRFSIDYAAARHVEVSYISDNDSKKWGTTYQNIPVISPDEMRDIANDDYEIVITVGPKALDEISKQLESMGFSYDKDFTTSHDKFFKGMIPSRILPGYVYENDTFISVKPLTDCALFTTAEHKYVFRAVSKEKAEKFRTVYERIASSETLRSYIIETSIAKDSELTRTYPLVFQHEYLPVLSYPSEWSPIMFRDYVLFMTDFILALDTAGLGLQDPSLYNVTFHNGRFLYVDFTGIYWDKTNWFIMQTFIELHINTLILLVKCQSKGYLYLRNPMMTVKYADIIGYLDEEENAQYLKILSDCEKFTSNGDITSMCKLLREYIISLTAEFTSLSEWTGYQSRLFSKTSDEETLTPKQKEVLALVQQTNPKTVLDLAGNMGWYSIALSKKLDYAITIDIDFGISDCAYTMVKKAGCQNVYPIRLNFITPTPAVYRSLPIYTDAVHPHRKGAIERFRCDTVLALAVIHHLALTQSLTFPEIIGQFALFTNRYLIIEFVDREDTFVIQYLRQYEPSDTVWYTKESFEQALNEKFTIVAVRPSDNPTRTLYLCERR